MIKKRSLQKGFFPYESNSFCVKKFTLYWGRNTRNFRTGFTLIELLVVISIISLIASVALASLNTARAKARDAALLSDVKSLINALELYYNDYGEYPPARNYAPPTAFLYCFTGSCNTLDMEGSNTGGTDTTFKLKMAPYITGLPSPTKRSTGVYKFGSIRSPISYTRPFISGSPGQVIEGLTGIKCDSPPNTSSKICYVIAIRTETETTLGPANTPIYLINGNAKIINTQLMAPSPWTFYALWGIF